MSFSARQVMRRGADRMLRPIGGRILTRAEATSIEQRHRRLVNQVYASYAARFSPPLDDRPGRMEVLYDLIGTETSEALFLLHWLQEALDGPGDVCEFGVAQGATSALLANEIRDTDRTLWLYDSFQGLSTPDKQKDELIDDIFELGSMNRYAGSMAYTEESVRCRLEAVRYPVDRTMVVPGYISRELSSDLLPKLVAFAYLDFDLYDPIRVALDLLDPRSRPGSVLMVDDYGYFSTGPQTAVEEFMADHGDRYELLVAPSGAGHFCGLRRTG